MNILKNVFNWTIGSFFRTIGRIFAFIVIGFLIFLLLQKMNIDITNIFMPKLSAATLTSYDTYQKIWNQESGCGTSNRYSYTQYANNNPGNDLWDTGVFGTQYSGKAAILGFNFQHSLTAGKYYDIEVNFNTSDLSSSLNTTNVFVESGTSCQDTSGSRVSLIGFTLSNSGTNYSNKATIRIMANSATTYWGFYFYKGVGQYVTGVNNWRINSLTITEVDPSNTNIVIDNATNNTTNIINNNNENTQQIIDNQNELLGNKCGNLYNFVNYQNGSIGNNSTDESLSSSNQALTTDWIIVESNTTYYISGDYNRIRWQLKNGNTITFGGTNSSINTGNNTQLRVYYYWSDTSTTGSQHKISISKSSTYCEYGSYSSKLDNVNDSINDDNTSQAQNKAVDYFNNFNDNDHGLSSILTLPLNSIRLMLSDTCVAPHTIYKGKTISLPCGDILWSRPGASALKDFLNVVYGGFICYYLIVNLFAWINKFKDPDNDKIEVVDL